MSIKVRIYELSKELNLDNKEILAVCDQLNIAVKNHSSTITESEAENIRQSAHKLHMSGATAHSAGQRRESKAPAKPIVTKTKEAGKQQILEVRRHKPDSGAEQDRTHSPTTTTAPKSVAPTLTPPKLSRPSDSSPSRTPEASALGAVAAEESISADNLGALPSESQNSISEAVPTRKPMEIKEVREAPNPNLVNPPARQGGQKPSPTLKPVLKSSQAGASPSSGSPSAPSVDTGLRKRRDAAPSNGGSDAGSDRAPIPILLKKPSQPRPVRSTGAPEIVEHRREGRSSPPIDDIPLIPVIVPGEEDLKLRRPTVNRPKRGKAEVEEEEMAELLNKAPKTGVKQKRRTVEEDEDDDLLNDDLNTQSTVVDVSQSLVRPPKQKTAKQSRPAPTATSRPGPQKGGSGRRSRGRDRAPQELPPEKPTLITLSNNPTVQELASLMAIPDTDVIKVLFLKGIAANINQTLDLATTKMVAEELGVEVETAQEESAARKVTEMIELADLESLVRRPPVVTIMGHVDHGKTTLLDSIRKTKVAQGEAGGITQHIGAYHVDLEHNGAMQQVVFLDTPGHEAFTAMRARGARVTDIAILVVAADDGVRPQTIEAISHAQAAKVPIIVAINKMDKEAAQLDRVKQELTEFGLVAEEWGGETVMVPVSALKGENLDTLLEMILLVAEVEDLQANPDRPAKGTVVEANLDKARGPVATLLVQNGTLRVGDVMVVGSVFGKVRAMIDDRGERVNIASPSFAVEVLGLNDVPAAGDEFEVLGDEKEARAVASTRADLQRQTRLQQAMSSRRISLGTLSDQVREGELKELNIILKADVQGSLEAILASLGQLPQNEVQVRVLFSAPGEVTETDVDLAAASNAVIIGFNTSLASGARQAADKASVDIREYNIIYKLLEDIQAAMEGLLDPELVEEPLGQAEVRAVFSVGRGAVAGCYVQSGKLVRNCRIRVRRGNDVVYEGILDSLKRMKEDTKEVNFGYECGVGTDNFNEWKESDIIESYQLVTKRRTLSMV
ncbi:MAG: translation initiation factor IF-2 [Acaryochloridaceae cyanobacterium RU_4_10]|nr:translation initiation factor IF-2 [Acaryochloridaceae cyanobacterium RU_4_10]